LALGVFLVANILSGYVSVGSLLAGISIPVLFLRVFQYQSLSIQVFSISVAVLILVTHRKNMQRLWLGEETKSRILGKKNKA
jgi:glycerol-3-phosphate acyltransferase PlsY